MYTNRQQQLNAQKRHYQANKSVYIERARLNKIKAFKRNRQFVNHYLKTHPCVDCGIQDRRVLEFDHLDSTNKIDNVSGMVRNCSSLDKIKEEISKCEVRCSNCHRIKNFETIWKV